MDSVFPKAENKELRKWAAARRTESIFSGFEFSSKKQNTLAASPPKARIPPPYQMEQMTNTRAAECKNTNPQYTHFWQALKMHLQKSCFFLIAFGQLLNYLAHRGLDDATVYWSYCCRKSPGYFAKNSEEKNSKELKIIREKTPNSAFLLIRLTTPYYPVNNKPTLAIVYSPYSIF